MMRRFFLDALDALLAAAPLRAPHRPAVAQGLGATRFVLAGATDAALSRPGGATMWMPHEGREIGLRVDVRRSAGGAVVVETLACPLDDPGFRSALPSRLVMAGAQDLQRFLRALARRGLRLAACNAFSVSQADLRNAAAQTIQSAWLRARGKAQRRQGKRDCAVRVRRPADHSSSINQQEQQQHQQQQQLDIRSRQLRQAALLA